MVSSPKVCMLEPHYTMVYHERNTHTFYVILDYLQGSFIHQEGPWGRKEGKEPVIGANLY